MASNKPTARPEYVNSFNNMLGGKNQDGTKPKPRGTPVQNQAAEITKDRAAPKASSKPVKTVKTKGGDYPVYKKSSSEAQSFRSAFAAARKSGKKVFEWQGRKYNTKVK